MIALHRQSIRSIIRTVTLVAALTSLLLTMATPFVGTARAAHDDPYDASDGSLDSAAFVNASDACGGNQDSQAVGGTKLDTIHLDPPPVLDDGSVTPKDNLCDFWIDSAIDAHGDVWLYAAFTRATTTGTAHVAIELLDEAAGCDASDYAGCNPWANRAAGTRIIGFTWQGNDGLVSPTLWEWSGSGFGAGQPLGDAFTGSTGQGGAFGEIAVNLSDGEPPIIPNVNETAECESIAAVIPLTLPGLSLGSQPKDVVLGDFPPIENCGSLQVTKVSSTGADYGDTFPISLGDPGGVLQEQALGHDGSFTVVDLFASQAYTVAESVPDGWSIVSIVCSDGSSSGPGETSLGGITVTVGATTSCVVTNTPDLPTVTLEKTVVNDDGGTATADDFQAHLGGGAVDWDVATDVAPGTHTASESTLPGYTPGDWGGACSADGAVTVDLGDHVTCTITNDDEPASLTLEKVVVNDDGGTATADHFAPTVGYDGTGDASAVTTDPDWTSYDVPAGTYTVGETDADGHSLLADGEYVLSSIVCDGEETSSITLGNGDSGACVVTNTDVPSGLTVVKIVNNQHGGTLQAGDFPLTVNDQTVQSGVSASFPAGSYTISEEQQDGYRLVDAWCTRDGERVRGIRGESFQIDVGLNEQVVCTFENRDVPARVRLVKTVVNDDGGTLEADDFPAHVDELDVDWEQWTTVPAGPHTAWEEQQPGYTDDGWSGDCAEDGTFTAELDTDYTCRITNDDQPATVTLVKTVVNDDGGTLTAGDFPAYVDEEQVAWGEPIGIGAGQHVVSEDQQPGYAASAWGGDCAEDGRLDAELGGQYECTIINDDIAPTVTLVKQVSNDDGGTLDAGDFPVTLDGQDAAWGMTYDVTAGGHTVGEIQQPGYRTDGWSGDCIADEDPTTGTFTAELDTDYTCTIINDDIAPTVVLRKSVINDDGGTLTQDDFPVTLDGGDVAWDEVLTTTAGDHVAAETTQPGYMAGTWGGDCAADGSMTAELAGTYECTITNDDVAAGLTVVKEVVNDDGGTAGPGDFPLTVTPEGGETATVTSGAQTFVAAGTYRIGEEQQPGYVLDSISCDDGTTSDGDTLDVTVGLDELVVCTVVNDDLPIGIEVIKVPDVTEIDFVPGGEDEVITYSYTVTNTGETTLTDLSLVDDVLGDIELPVDELAPGQTVVVLAEHVVTQEDAEAGEVVNVVVVEGTSPDGRTATDDDDAEVLVDDVEVLPLVLEQPAPLPATGADTMRLALWAALVAGLGGLLLLSTGEAARERRRE